jgi:DinB superfamily
VSIAVDPRYPVGKFVAPQGALTAEQREPLLAQITEVPAKLREAVLGLDESQLDTPYREGGWTSRQVVHHVADSHMTAFFRFKLGLTEENPTISPYPEHLWADLADQELPIEVSLPIVDGVHRRWVSVLRSMKETDWARSFHHPVLGVQRLDRSLALYAWHGRHHVAHIAGLRGARGW